MKRTDLEKLKGLKINEAMKRAAVPGRYGQDAAQSLSRKERRRLEESQGLVPFAVKLDAALVQRLHDAAAAKETTLSQLVAELLTRGLDASPRSG